DDLFETYARLLEATTEWAAERYPRAEDESTAAHRRAVRAKALDLVRGLLPAASLSHVGMYASGQTYEQLVLHLLAHPLVEARAALVRELVGERENRRHRPGRGFETLRYRFEIVSDYGAFRDLQRHRLLTCQWQRLSPALGADVPHELVAAGLGGDFERALDVSRREYERLRDAGLAEGRPHRSASPSAPPSTSD